MNQKNNYARMNSKKLKKIRIKWKDIQIWTLIPIIKWKIKKNHYHFIISASEFRFVVKDDNS